jgi:signal transduction histidine kinase
VRLHAEVETAVYRIVQEALTNAVKHAGANHVSVVVTRKSTTVHVVIEDDGSGFDPGAVSTGGLGLLGMRERVELLDGTFEIDTSPRAGTTLIVELPVG